MSFPSQRKFTPGPRPTIVLGAGIIGLTTAIRLLESPICKEGGHEVHIIADHLPNDPLDPRYASTIAGAHHLSFAEDADLRQVNWDKETFRVMYDEWKAEGENTGLMVINQTEYYVGTKKHLKIYESHPDFKINDVTNLPGVDHSVSFTTLTMSPLTYLNRLLKRINQLSNSSPGPSPKCQIHRIHLSSLSDLSTPPLTALIGLTPPLAVIICVGLGARTLGEVNDETVYPTRGQVLKIKAPWIRDGCTKQVAGHGGERTYVIPRYNGEVICGGTRDEHDWFPYARAETKKDILERVTKLYPELLPPHLSIKSRVKHDQSTLIEDDEMERLVIDHLVGFRPSRKQGVRLEPGPDIYLGSSTSPANKDKDELGTKVVYNYGHGGAGWQSCWGTASDAIKTLEGILEHP